jgi:hypothetical protein
MKICVKNRRSNTSKRKILFFSIEKFFFSDVQIPEHILKQLEATFRKIWCQNISLKDPNPKKNLYPNPKKMSSDPQHRCTVPTVDIVQEQLCMKNLLNQLNDAVMDIEIL